MENNDMMYEDIGSYRFIRSSQDKNAMIGWGEPEYIKTHNRWLEFTGFAYCCYWDSKASLEADEFDLDIFHREHPEYAVRESYWDIDYGEKKKKVDYAFFLFEERENGELYSCSISIEDCSLEELEKWQKAVREWHLCGKLKFDSFKCSSFTIYPKESYSFVPEYFSKPEEQERFDETEELSVA